MNTEVGGKRARQEEIAIGALLTEPTIVAAAQKVGIGGATLRRWLADPSFRVRYRDARGQVVEQAIARVQQATSEAVSTLRRNLTCGVPATEISAAKGILDLAVKGVELTDLVERVERLERGVGEEITV